MLQESSSFEFLNQFKG